MKKLVIICGLSILAGNAAAQRSGYKTVRKPKPGTAKTTSAKPGMNSRTAARNGKTRRPQQEGRKFNISLGISLALSNSVTKSYMDPIGSGTLTKSATAFGVFVYPKYSFYSTEKYSISVGIPLTLAFSGSASANSRTGTAEGSASFSYDLPLMFDFNGGCMAPQGRYGESRFGYFAGVGFGIQNGDATSYTYSGTGSVNYDADLNAKSVGPNIHAGGVFRFGSEERPRFIGLRIGYKFGLNADGHNYITPSVFLNI